MRSQAGAAHRSSRWRKILGQMTSFVVQTPYRSLILIEEHRSTREGTYKLVPPPKQESVDCKNDRERVFDAVRYQAGSFNIGKHFTSLSNSQTQRIPIQILTRSTSVTNRITAQKGTYILLAPLVNACALAGGEPAFCTASQFGVIRPRVSIRRT